MLYLQGNKLYQIYSINFFSSIILDSDWPAMNAKLNDIRESLKNLKDFRLNMPSKNYYQ